MVILLRGRRVPLAGGRMSLKVFSGQLEGQVGAERAAELINIGRLVVRYGFRQWAWYRLAEKEIMGQVGFNDLVTEVVGEILMAEQAGLEGQAAIDRAQANVCRELRKQYSFEYGRHQSFDYEDVFQHEPAPSLQPPPDEELRARIEAVLTPFQLQVCETVASVGSTQEAANILGLKARQQVTQALRYARRKLEAAGITE